MQSLSDLTVHSIISRVQYREVLPNGSEKYSPANTSSIRKCLERELRNKQAGAVDIKYAYENEAWFPSISFHYD